MGKLEVIAQPGTHVIVMTRDFNAPRDLVFKAFTDPKLIPQWWGGGGGTTVVDKMEARAGGQWRYVEKTPDGDYGFHGVYHEVTPERIVYTFEFEGMPGHVLLETVELNERDGRTYLTDVSVFQTVEARDGMIASGMEGGANLSWDKLEALLSQR